jgi:hypothetical protein
VAFLRRPKDTDTADTDDGNDELGDILRSVALAAASAGNRLLLADALFGVAITTTFLKDLKAAWPGEKSCCDAANCTETKRVTPFFFSDQVQERPLFSAVHVLRSRHLQLVRVRARFCVFVRVCVCLRACVRVCMCVCVTTVGGFR